MLHKMLYIIYIKNTKIMVFRPRDPQNRDQHVEISPVSYSEPYWTFLAPYIMAMFRIQSYNI